jgi:uncharacterized repeat protein (TIGR01451 family)
MPLHRPAMTAGLVLALLAPGVEAQTIGPVADLGISLVDVPDPVLHGAALSYVAIMTNAGPSDATGVTLTDVLPPDVTFVYSVPGPPTCTLAGASFACDMGPLAAGGTTTATIHVTVNAPAGSTIVNTATVSGNEADPNPANNSATATTTVAAAEAELSHGTNMLLDLAALPGPVADQDVFRISQRPRSSYEVVVDSTSGDIGSVTAPGANPLRLERMAPDAQNVLQTSVPIALGSARSLRWTTGDTQIDDQFIRVRSGMGSCTTNCGTDDVYRIRVYETTYALPRFDNTPGHATFLVLQNSTDYEIDYHITFYSQFGGDFGGYGTSLGPRKTAVIDTRDMEDLVSGSITIVHDGRYGDLIGKAMALDLEEGFSFDTALEPRRNLPRAPGP